MPIIKPGFEEGFRARKSASTLQRRMYYLANPEIRESAVLLQSLEGNAEPDLAIRAMGGDNAEYHEVIVAPSLLECQAIRECSHAPGSADVEAARRLSQAYAGEKPFVTAVHGSEDGRFHFHILVSGPYPERLTGEHGIMQKVWDENWVIRERRTIENWTAWREYQQLQEALKEARQEARERSRLRRAELRGIPEAERGESLSRFRQVELDLALRQADMERRSIEARFRAFGRSGSVFEAVEQERAGQRHAKELRQIEGRHLRGDIEGAWSRSLAEIRDLRQQALEVGQGDPARRESALQAYRQAQGALLEQHHLFEQACARREWEMKEGQDPRNLERALRGVEERLRARVAQMELGFRLDEVRAALRSLRAEPGPGASGDGTRKERERALLEERRELRIRLLEAEMTLRGRLWSPEHKNRLEQLAEAEDRRLKGFETLARLDGELRAARERMRELRALAFPAGGPGGVARDLGSEDLAAVSSRILALELSRVEHRRGETLAQAEADLERARAFRARRTAAEGQRLLEEVQRIRHRATESGKELGLGAGGGEARGERVEALAVEIRLEMAALAMLKEASKPGSEEAAITRAAESLAAAQARLEKELGQLDRVAADARARFEGLAIGRSLEGEIREVREGLRALREGKRLALQADRADPGLVLADFRAREAPLLARLAGLEERRLEARFQGRSSGMAAQEYREARDRLREDQFLRARIRAVRDELDILRTRDWQVALSRPGGLERARAGEAAALRTLHHLQVGRVELRHEGKGTLGSPGHLQDVRILDQDLAKRTAQIQARSVCRQGMVTVRGARVVRTLVWLHGRDPEQVLAHATKAAGRALLNRALARVPVVRIIASVAKSIVP